MGGAGDRAVERRAPLHSLSSSSRGLRLVEGPGLDRREQHVQPATSQAHHRSIMPLPLSPFPVVIRPRQRVMTRRHPGRVEQRVLQPFVPRPRRKLTPNRCSRPPRLRSNTRIRSQMPSSPEREEITGRQEDLRRGLNADSQHRRQDLKKRERISQLRSFCLDLSPVQPSTP